MASPIELSNDEVRRIQLRAQGLLGSEGRRSGVTRTLSRLGAVQLDTISVLARSHELVPYARLGSVGRQKVETAYWGKGTTFEYWAHAACILPVEEWPYFGFRRRHYRARGLRWHKVPENTCDEVLARLRSDGPLTTGDLGGARRRPSPASGTSPLPASGTSPSPASGTSPSPASGTSPSPASGRTTAAEWWDWSDVKVAVEWLLDIGEVICSERIGWRRVYDLPERVLPAALLEQDLSDAECLTRLVAKAGRSLGVATRADLADYYRLKQDQVDAVVAGSGLVPARVPEWRNGDAWADPAALAVPVRGRHRTSLLSPFDSLVWDRKRTARIFGFDHRLEAYVPKAKRIHGYFAMPLLAGGRLIGRVDPAREGSTLVARRVFFEPREIATPTRAEVAATALCDALFEAASWVGCTDVRVEVVTPADLLPAITSALRPALADLR